MSRGNADRARKIYALLSRRDVDSVLDFFAPEFEVDWSRSMSGMKGVYTDREEVGTAWLDHWVDPWEWMELEVVEATELDDDTVICITHVRMRGRGSGAEVEATGAALWTFADGLVTGSVLYQSREDAMAALRSER